MKWLLDRFGGSRRRQTGVACYLRENGPIAYELSLFAESPRDRVDAMFETGLSWHWTTERSGNRSEPAEWIELTRWSMAALLADIASAEGTRGTVIVGIEQQEARPDLARDLVEWGRRFATDERSPMHVLVDRSDGQPDRVFVAQQPPESVRALLQAWGIDRARAARRAYPRLRERSLESVVDRIRR